MTATSKTMSAALSELKKGLEESESITISGLARQLAESLYHNYQIYLPPGKKLDVSIGAQKANKLYSATFRLVDDVENQKGVS